MNGTGLSNDACKYECRNDVNIWSESLFDTCLCCMKTENKLADYPRRVNARHGFAVWLQTIGERERKKKIKINPQSIHRYGNGVISLFPQTQILFWIHSSVYLLIILII